jgi:Asp-tRNA(Asn)/Glu-tRNA(Gln) amidotransferase A subunit family amidase
MTEHVTDAPLAVTADRLRAGEHSLSDYAEGVADRVADVDPDVRALVGGFDRDRFLGDTAAVADAYDKPWERPPLYGVPVGVKDVFHVDGFPTRAGSDIPPAELTGEQSAAVSALEAAGAVVLGKTVTTEFAYFEPGPTRNPNDLTRTPGGSSSGSAAAVAAGLCPLALGTQTVGSTIRPAAFCGIVGYKPSLGRIDTAGVLPFSPTMDHVGVFTQDVPGTELAASVLCDGWDPTTPEERPVLGVPEGPYLDHVSDAGLAAFDDHLDALEEAGYEVRRFDAFPGIEERYDKHHPLIAAEIALAHDEQFEAHGDRLAAMTRELFEDGRATTAEEMADGRESQRAFRAEIHGTMDEEGVDLLVCPAAPGPAPEGIDATGDPAMNLPWTHAGTPALTVPAGDVDGLPVGLQCVARFGHDESLLAWSGDVAGALVG